MMAIFLMDANSLTSLPFRGVFMFLAPLESWDPFDCSEDKVEEK